MPDEPVVIAVTREWASHLALAVFVVDPDGDLLYYNDAAGEILGKRFEETGAMTLAVWSTLFEPTDPSGAPLMPGKLPLVVALRDRRPAHRELWIRGADGQRRQVQVTAFPLLGPEQELVGATALFWESLRP
jgi:PAS domain-containing protein